MTHPNWVLWIIQWNLFDETKEIFIKHSKSCSSLWDFMPRPFGLWMDLYRLTTFNPFVVVCICLDQSGGSLWGGAHSGLHYLLSFIYLFYSSSASFFFCFFCFLFLPYASSFCLLLLRSRLLFFSFFLAGGGWRDILPFFGRRGRLPFLQDFFLRGGDVA